MNRRTLLRCAAALLAAAAPLLSLAPRPASAQGFGRFGRINDDGLLTLNVTPAGFSSPPTSGGVKVRWGNGGTPVRATVTKIDPTEKRLKLTGGGQGAPTAVRYSLLYPGLSATFGATMTLRVDAPASGLVVSVVAGGGGDYALLRPADDSTTQPIVVAFRPGVRVSASNGTGGVTFRAAQPLGEVRVVTPYGITGMPKQQQSAPAAAVKRWAGIGVPTRTASRYALSADGRSVTITETFTGGIAPLPPVLAFAIKSGYPARVQGQIVTTECRTKWGPFAYVAGNTLRYTLPVPPSEERAYVRAAKPAPAQVRLLNDLVGHLGGSWAQNGVDLGYAGFANAHMAWAYLTQPKRAEVMAAWKAHLPHAFALPPYAASAPKKPWKAETEPFTGQQYLWTYFIDGPGDYRYDIEWGNALPLYGLYKYAQYTGDWALVRKNWADVQRIDRYMALGDDWAWMTVVNADHGFSTGTGDPMDAAYCGAVACYRMARALGDRAATEKYAARVARVAVPTVARFWYTDYARRHGLIGATSVALGFHETEGYTRSQTTASPWWISSLLSGDGVQPELFALLGAYGKPALRRYEDRYAKAYPRWFDGNHKYPYAASYAGNSVYVAFPHVYARAAVLEEPTPSLVRFVNGIQVNRNNAWVGPNVVAELLSRKPGGTQPTLVLTEWRPAAYRDGYLTPDGGRAVLKFRRAGGSAAWTVSARLAPGVAVRAARVNGRAAAAAVSTSGRVVSVRTDATGDVTVELDLR